MIEDARARIEKRYLRTGFSDFLRSEVLAKLLPHPARFRRVLLPVKLLDTLGLRDLASRLLPPRLARMVALLPDARRWAGDRMPDLNPAEGRRRGRVGSAAGERHVPRPVIAGCVGTADEAQPQRSWWARQDERHRCPPAGLRRRWEWYRGERRQRGTYVVEIEHAPDS